MIQPCAVDGMLLFKPPPKKEEKKKEMRTAVLEKDEILLGLLPCICMNICVYHVHHVLV